MSDKTEINLDSGATVINNEKNENAVINAEANKATEVNTEYALPSLNIPEGTVIGEKYIIGSPMDVSTGEADLYICDYDSKQYVAKVYRRKNAVKPGVIEKLKSIDSPYVAKMYETGAYNGFPFEILPYYRNGSLQGKKYSFDELKKNVISSINEALYVLHQNGIIHKDLKPSNIMLLDNDEGVAIIDFGISSVTENGNTVLMTKTGMTPEYSAPETFRNLFLEESDYYSFGITLFELFCGNTPYKNMNAEEIARFTAVQRIPFPDYMPEELQNLISAVTYFDITNRHDKSNPNRRWTYEEVKNWCDGKQQPVPGEGTEAVPEKAIPTYKFSGNAYNDIVSLANALGANWNEGKKQLYRGLLSGFFKGFEPEIAGYCMDAEEEAGRKTSSEDIVFWELLYKICPEMNAFYWCGRSYGSLPVLGTEMLEKLWKNDTSDRGYWNEILSKKLLSRYLKLKKSDNSALLSAASALEAAHSLESKSEHDYTVDFYTMAYLLSGKKILCIGGKQMKDVSELTAYMKNMLESSYDEFEAFCLTMIDNNDTLDAQLEAWLIANGKRNELEAWKNQLK